MAFATLTIDLLLKLAAFEADAGRAARIAGDMNAKMQAGAEAVGKAFGTMVLASAAASTAAVALFDRNVKSAAAYKALADQAGTTAQAFAQLVPAADASGLSTQRLASLMSNLGVRLSRTTDETRGTGAGLRALGISLAEFKSLRPEQQLELLAKRLASFGEGAGRGAAATAVLGEQARAALPFLLELGEAGLAQVRLTQQQIEQADRYARAQEVLRSELTQLAQVAAVQALPAVIAFTEALRDTAGAVISVDRATGNLAESDAIGEFARDAAKSLGFVVDAADGVKRTVELLGVGIGANAAKAAALLTFNLESARTQIRAISEAAEADVERILQRPLFTDRLRQRLEAPPAPAPAPRPQLDFTLPARPRRTETRELEQAARAYDRLIASVRERQAAADAELTAGRELSESQRFAAEVVGKLSAAESKLSDAQKQSATRALELYLATAGALELRKAQADAAEQLARSEAASADALGRVAEARLEANAALRDELITIGLSADQVERLRTARLEEAIAAERMALAVARARDASDAEAAGLERNLALLEEQLRLRQQAAAAAERLRTDAGAGVTRGLSDAARGLGDQFEAARGAVLNIAASVEDNLVSAIVRGKVEARQLLELIGSEAVRTFVVRPALAQVFGQAAGASAPAGAGAAALAAQTAAFSAQTSAVATSTGALTALTQAAGAAAAALASISASSGAGAALGLFGAGVGTGLEGLTPDALSFFFHNGGVVGAGGRAARVPASVFEGARRYHGGGIAGLAPDEVPSILRRGEEVVRRDDSRHRANGGGRTMVIVNAPPGTTVARQEERETGGGRELQLWLQAAVSEVDRRIATGGSTYSTMKSRFGLQPVLPRRS